MKSILEQWAINHAIPALKRINQIPDVCGQSETAIYESDIALSNLPEELKDFPIYNSDNPKPRERYVEPDEEREARIQKALKAEEEWKERNKDDSTWSTYASLSYPSPMDLEWYKRRQKEKIL